MGVNKEGVNEVTIVTGGAQGRSKALFAA